MLLKKLLLPCFYIVLAFVLFRLQSSFIYGGDSAEFSYVAQTLTTPHPPGYPFYTFLLYLVTRLVPLGTIPWKAAVISSVSTVVTLYFVYKILDLILHKRSWAFFLSLFYLGLFPVMLYGLVPEVFALNNALLAGITYGLFHYHKTKKNWILYLSFFCMGLAAAHHHIFVVFVPGWYFLSGIQIRKIKYKTLGLAFLFACIGFSFYILPFISYSVLNKTIPQWLDLSTLKGLIQLILRTPYGSFKAYTGATPFIYSQITGLIGTLTFIVADFKVLGIFFIVIGLMRVRHLSKPFARFLYTTLIVQAFFIFYANFLIHDTFNLATFERFLIFIYLNLMFAFTIGIYSFVHSVQAKMQPYIKTRAGKKIIPLLLIGFVFVFFLLFSIPTWTRIVQLKTIKAFDEFTHDVLDTIPKNGVLNTLSDLPYFTTLYTYHVEQYRHDVKFFSFGFLSSPHYAERVRLSYPDLVISKQKPLQLFLRDNQKNAFISENPYPFGFWLPYGFFWKYYRTDEARKKDIGNVLKTNEHLWNEVYHIPKLNSENRDFLFLYELQNYYLFAYVRYSEFLMQQNKFPEAKKILDTIRKEYNANYMPMRVGYLDLYVRQKKCVEAANVRNSFSEQDLNTYPDYQEAEKLYQKTCNP